MKIKFKIKDKNNKKKKLVSQSKERNRDRKQNFIITHQLEVCNPNCTFVIHLLLVFILNQTLHQITCVDLVISYILHTQITMQTSKMFLFT